MEAPVLVNSYYPLGYFANTNVQEFAFSPPDQFWASREEYPTAEEWLEIDFGVQRPCNFIDFEISQKPVTITIQYDDNGIWRDIVPKDFIDPIFTIHYLPSQDNPWTYFEAHFNLVKTRKIKLLLARRADPFPFPDSALFPWSIDIRNLRAIHVIQTLDEFLEDTGVDVLGNEYRTDLEVYDEENVLDGDDETFWESQPNPSRFAVEYLYFDLREGWRIGTMGWCNTQSLDSNQDEIEGATMSDIELKYLDGVVIDEVFIDPVTFGPTMNIYYSLDDQADWDDKLWIPVTRQYILKKGYHSLPTPTFVKFVKLEFTDLAAAPYNALEYPDTKPIEYRKFPTWVTNYFLGIYPKAPEGSLTQENISQIVVDPTELGFMNPIDRFSTQFSEIAQAPLSLEDMEQEVSSFIEDTVKGTEITEVDKSIQFRPVSLFRNGLNSLIDITRTLGRFVARYDEAPWDNETQPEALGEPQFQSRQDLSEVQLELQYPAMYFPRKTRHGYQIIEAIRPSKIAYFVGIREVRFHRRDYTVEFDEAFYIETLDDDDHVALNEFELDDFRYTVTPHSGSFRPVIIEELVQGEVVPPGEEVPGVYHLYPSETTYPDDSAVPED